MQSDVHFQIYSATFVDTILIQQNNHINYYK